MIKENAFSPYIRILGKGKSGARSLTQQEAYDAFSLVLNNQVEDVQLGAFLMLLRVKEESPEELAGFVQACRDYIKAPAIQIDLDWSSYAGKRKQHPWFILSVILLAQQGYRVFMHGTKGHTDGRLYTEDAFRLLGLPVATSWEQVQTQLTESNLSFMPLSSLCAPLQRLIDMRNLFGLRSPVHTLSRLINPLAAPLSIQSIFHPAYAGSHQQASLLLNQPNMCVFKGESGEIERKPEANCLVKFVAQGSEDEEKWERVFQGKQEPVEQASAEHVMSVFNGEVSDEYGEQAVVLTLAIALRHIENISQEQALAKAEALWKNRQPFKNNL